MRRLGVAGIAVVVTVLVVPSVAAARGEPRTVVAPGEHSRPYQDWIDRVKRVHSPSIKVEVQEFGWGCGSPTALGCVDVRRRMIFMRHDAGRSTFVHELGHLHDHWRLSPRDRRRFSRLIGRRARSWQTVRMSRAGERYAEVYRHCAQRRRIRVGVRYTAADATLNGRRLRRACGFIARIGP